MVAEVTRPHPVHIEFLILKALESEVKPCQLPTPAYVHGL